jgi:hypothetical protein
MGSSMPFSGNPDVPISSFQKWGANGIRFLELPLADSLFAWKSGLRAMLQQNPSVDDALRA